MRSSRDNSRYYGPSHRGEDSNYGNNNAGYSDRYIYQRDFEDYDAPYENQSYRRNTDDFDRGYRDEDYRGYETRNYGNSNRNRYSNSGYNQWNEGYDRNYGQGNTSGRINREDRDEDDRNFFQRAGDKIRETWNDWRHRHNDGYDQDQRRFDNNRHNGDRWPEDDHYYSDRGVARGEDENRYGGNSGRYHWGNNSNYNNNRGQDNRSSRPRHDYSYGHSGSIRWNSADNNERYYNGQSSGRSFGSRRSRELQEDYPY